MQPAEEEPAEVVDLGCGRPPLVAVSELTVDGATMAARWEAREDYIDEVRAVSVILQQEQYLDGARVGAGALHVANVRQHVVLGVGAGELRHEQRVGVEAAGRGRKTEKE